MQPLFAYKCFPAASKHPTAPAAPSLQGRGSRHKAMHVPAPTGSSRGQNEPLILGTLSLPDRSPRPRVCGAQPPCPWPGIVPALPEQGHGPQIRKESIHLRSYQQRSVQTSHFLRSVSDGFPSSSGRRRLPGCGLGTG